MISPICLIRKRKAVPKKGGERVFRGLYTAATGMNLQLNRQDAIANNLANINTAGYKRDEAIGSSFRERLVTARDHRGEEIIGAASLGVNLDRFYVDHTTGKYNPTENPLDLAISGEGYFLVETERGQHLTRNGEFSMDRDGYLVTAEGGRVLGRNGPIPLRGDEVLFLGDGTVLVDGGPVNRIMIVRPVDPDSLMKEGHNRFLFSGEWEEIPDSSIIQGMVEESNVSPIAEMVTMIEVTRAYESNQKVIHVYDEVMRKAANELGRV